MSMTMVAFYSKAKSPTKVELESEIAKLNYDFKFLGEFESINEFGGTCQLNGKETFFQTYVVSKREILNDYDFLNKDIEEFDSGISFIWGADFIAGACIGIISTALIDLCGAKIVYVDDETWYTRQMLLDEIPIFIEEHKKQIHKRIPSSSQSKQKKKTEWMDWAIIGLMIISAVLLKREIITWHIPTILIATYIGYSIWTKRK
ncbi:MULTISPECIES: hypothetical protein [Flavobacteriaceae]|uniref:hypothetical protein n=1 Tax=Flavobacteriaceae TaxID=49546 RepID=UPI0014925C16|nr:MULTISPECIES: hypothetical protein [Allomuricauda]MDC6367218.1 hypothetical protein [Muricauda sp. AC10]